MLTAAGLDEIKQKRHTVKLPFNKQVYSPLYNLFSFTCPWVQMYIVLILCYAAWFHPCIKEHHPALAVLKLPCTLQGHLQID